MADTTPRLTAVAHRGDPYRARENTLPSIRSALDRGA
ncbi:glycerophosphodiester phosphodiesterase, partial [Streptomyces cavourensis]